jgi:hypothetical protein
MPLSIKNPSTVRRAMRSYSRHRKQSQCRGRPQQSCTSNIGCFWTHGKNRNFCRKIKITKRGSQSCDCPPKHKFASRKFVKPSKYHKSNKTYKKYRTQQKGGINSNCMTWFGTGANCTNLPSNYNSNILDFQQNVPVTKFIPYTPLSDEYKQVNSYKGADFNSDYAPYNS